MGSIEKLLAEGSFELALDRVDKMLRASELGSSESLAAGRVSLLSNHLDKAESFFSSALSGGEVEKVAPLLAETYYRLGEFDPATEWFYAAGRTAMARKIESFQGTVPYGIRGEVSTRLKFVQTDPLPVVLLQVNDRAEGFFLVDTGGSELILDSDFGSRVGADRFGFEQGTFAGGKQSNYEHGRVGSLQLGDAVVRNLPVHLQPLGHLKGLAGRRRISGILGTVPLYHFTVTLDYPGGQLILREPGVGRIRERKEADRRVAQVPFWMDGDHFVLARGAVNGQPQLLFIDSGLAGGGFVCPESTLAEAGIPFPKGRALKGQGGGGTIEARKFTVDQLDLGTAQQRDIVGFSGVFPPFLEHHFGYRIGGLLSHGFLRHYRVTFDFQSMKIHLRA